MLLKKGKLFYENVTLLQHFHKTTLLSIHTSNAYIQYDVPSPVTLHGVAGSTTPHLTFWIPPLRTA
jgi:hypothetical protein